MKTFIVSYVSNSGLIILNDVVTSNNRMEAINEIKGDTGIKLVLSCVEQKK